jgi:ATP-dependent RNA helicase SUPV3L1/SUV3
VAIVDRTDGDIDTLSARIAQVRTWTFAANRSDWLADPEHWQGETRRVEDSLSDALHEKLAQRFVDRRTSVLMRRLKENAMLEAQITASGDVLVEGHDAGRLQGFRFTLSPEASGPDAKALRAAALKALTPEFETRAARFAEANDEAIVLASDGAVRWRGEVVGKLTAGDGILRPRVTMIADENISAPAREKIERRLSLWLAARIEKLLGPLLVLESPPDLTGVARGIAFQVSEAIGVLDRGRVAQDIKSLDQDGRAKLRALGLRFGAYHIYAPALIKPAPRALSVQLYALKHGGPEIVGYDTILQFTSSGRTSFPADPDAPKALYRAAGFRLCSKRAVRVDILERLADLIRPAVQYRPGTTLGTPPPGTAEGDSFVVTGQMTSLAGCAGEDFSGILTSLGYVATKRPGPAITSPLALGPQTAAVGEGTTVGETFAPSAPTPAPPPDDEPFLPGIVVDSQPATAPGLAQSPNETASQIAAKPPSSEILAAASNSSAVAIAAGALGNDQASAGSPPENVATSDSAAPDTQEMIEVWRLQRSSHQHHRPHSGRRHPHTEERERRARHRGPRSGDSPRTASELGVTGTADAALEADARRALPEQTAESGRPPRRNKPRRPQHDRAQPRTEGEGQRKLSSRTEARPPKAIDPDNPFAKLLALKARMEEEGRR